MKKGIHEFLWVAIPKALGGFATIGLSIVLLRFLGPVPYGIYALCITGILLSDSILGSALDMGVLRLSPLYRREDPKRSLGIERAALYLKIWVGGGICLILVLFSAPLSRLLFHQEGLAHLIWISCAAAFSMLFLRTALVHLQVDRRFTFYGILDLFHIGLKFGGIALVLVFFKVTPVSILLLFVIGPAIAFIIGLGSTGKKLLPPPEAHSHAYKELLSYTKWFLLTFCLGALISRIDIFLLTTLKQDMSEVGIFSGGFVFAMIPELLGSYLAIVFAPRIMPYLREGRFYPFFRRFQTLCIIGAIGFYGIIRIGLRFFSPYLLPPSFAPSLDIILILLPGALAGMATFPLTLSFLMFIRPSFLIIMDCITFPIMLGCYYYAIKNHGAIGAAWVTSMSRLAKALVAQIMAWKWASLPPEQVGIQFQTNTMGVVS